MTQIPRTHLDDEAIARLADALLTSAEARELDPHLSSCEECRQAVAEMVRGLAVLALASEPPPGLTVHVRARLWAAAHDRSSRAQPDAAENVEVAGRGMDTDLPDSTEPPNERQAPDEDD
jgi:anti-sigma factor RsiW